jgi:predicted PurR-regulated permease PerM
MPTPDTAGTSTPPATGPTPVTPRVPTRGDHWDSPAVPRWLPRALVMAAATVIVAILVWNAAGMLGNVMMIVIVSWFVALAMEPAILWLGRHRIRRAPATGLVMLGVAVAAGGVLTLLGGLFVNQLVDLVQSIPGYYNDLRQMADERFELDLPASSELLGRLGDYADDLAPGIVGVGTSIVGGVFNFTAILLVVYYMASAGPRFRAAVCRYLAPHRQREVLRVWEVSQDKVAGFINSRLALAAICIAATNVLLQVLGIPYALPLAVFTGLVSQFVPTIGTYIGGALPVLLALAVDPVKALIVLAFIVAYQQVENLLLTPKISQRSLELNPAVSFLSVLGFGAVFGALGAFLSLPVVATIQAVSSTYLRRHELVDPTLLDEETPRRKTGEDKVGEEKTGEDKAAATTGDAPATTAEDPATETPATPQA